MLEIGPNLGELLGHIASGIGGLIFVAIMAYIITHT